MTLNSLKVRVLRNKDGINDTMICTVDPWTGDYNHTRSLNLDSNQTALMRDHWLQGQETWIPIAIAVVLVIFLVIGIIIIIKKKTWFRETMMSLPLIKVITYLQFFWILEFI